MTLSYFTTENSLQHRTEPVGLKQLTVATYLVYAQPCPCTVGATIKQLMFGTYRITEKTVV